MRESRKYLDPETLSKISGLSLRARHVVEGSMAGIHPSPYHGLNVEFAEHRPYTPGHELKHIDWKLWARSDRLYVKLFEAETNVRAHFVVDGSRSMAYRSGAMSKYDYAATLAASLAHVLLTQQDAVSLRLLHSHVSAELPPAAGPAQLEPFCRLLEDHTPAGSTDMGVPLQQVADRIEPRGVIILISDLIAPLEEVAAALRRFRYEKHAVILVHVADPAEEKFPFRGRLRFEDMESPRRVAADAEEIRAAYLESYRRFRRQVEQECLQQEADYLEVRTDQRLDLTLARFLRATATRR